MNAAQILAFRRRRGWSQAQAAEAIGRSPRAWRMYERGREIPRVVALAVLSWEIHARNPSRVDIAMARIEAASPRLLSTDRPDADPAAIMNDL